MQSYNEPESRMALNGNLESDNFSKNFYLPWSSKGNYTLYAEGGETYSTPIFTYNNHLYSRMGSTYSVNLYFEGLVSACAGSSKFLVGMPFSAISFGSINLASEKIMLGSGHWNKDATNSSIYVYNYNNSIIEFHKPDGVALLYDDFNASSSINLHVNYNYMSN